MATVLRTMALGQNFHMLPNNCVIVSSSTVGSNGSLHAAGKRPIAPAPSDRSVRLLGGSMADLKGGKKRMSYSHMSPYPGPPPSVERRNARERNRVKQVNNGFDKLRQHIPQKIVEVENGGRGASKKLSKVDTLRLAVKYIQGLQQLLDDNSVHDGSSQGSSSYYAGSPIQSMQDTQPPCSEASSSPTPSYNSDVSVGHTYNPTSTPYQEQYHTYEAMHFEDEAVSFEEEVLLDDILHWQLQH